MSRTKIRVVIAALAVWVGGAVATGAQEQEPPSGLGVDSRALVGEPAGTPISGPQLDRATEELTGIMRCPVCQGLSVADSPSLSALAMKQEVRELLAAGYTRDQVLAYFEQAYGEFIRLEPKPEGFNLLVWIAPGAALILGALLLAFRYRSSTPPAVAEGDQPGGEDQELEAYRARVREEVQG